MAKEIIDSVEKLEDELARVREAQRKFSTYTQEQVDKIFLAAAKAAISSPLLETSIEGASALLINISGNTPTLMETQEAVDYINDATGGEPDVIFGVIDDPGAKDDIRVTVIATGFARRPDEEPEYSRPVAPKTPQRGNVEKQAPRRATGGYEDVHIPDFLRNRNR